jgi:hypothetical protein
MADREMDERENTRHAARLKQPVALGDRMFATDIRRMWRKAPLIKPGSPGWNYLERTRRLPAFSISNATYGGGLREGGDGTIWAMHQGMAGQITGWEMRGPRCEGFSTDAGKSLFRVGEHIDTTRVAVTESVIDALSLASIEGWQVGTLYASTGGGCTPTTSGALQVLLSEQVQLVGASDQAAGGELLACRLQELATECGAEFVRLRPDARSWNRQLAA